jgi:ComEC/Rec2-related protein
MVRGTHPTTGATVQIMARLPLYFPPLEMGQNVSMYGLFSPLFYPENPGGYNQFRHLRAAGADATLLVANLHRLDLQRSLMTELRRLRDRMAAVFDYALPPREAAVLRSMILGDRLDMDRELSDLYRVMGIFHILSISGMHVTILMLALNKVLGLVMDTRRAGLVALVIMVLYCLMTGAAEATVRAVIMGGVLVFSKVLGRENNLLAATAWACISILLFSPMQLFSAGFQLSFGAVFGMAILSAPIDRLLTMAKLRNAKARQTFSVGLAAVTSTYPIFAFHFYEIPLYSVLGNLVIAPTATMLLVLGIVVGIAGLLWMPAAVVLSGPVYYILRFYELAARVFSTLPGAMLQTGGGNVFITLAAFGLLAAFTWTFGAWGRSFSRRGLLLVLAAGLLALAQAAHVHPRALSQTQLAGAGGYTVLRIRGDALVLGAPLGGERDVLRYLDMHRIEHAALVLTALPRPQDAHRLATLLPRIHTIYVSGHPTGAQASFRAAALQAARQLLENAGYTMPPVVYVHHGEVRRAHGTAVEFTEGPQGILDFAVRE